jgi:multimeric flavodoxin WrbA
MDRILDAIAKADGFLFGTGTYWDSWGSPLQRFLEVTAHTEGQSYWVGKPACAIVTAHAVGAKGVLTRLLGVMNVYGTLIPPFAGFSYTFVADTALPHASDHLRNELWTADDTDVVCHNLLEALKGGRNWKQWPTNEGRYGDKWLNVYSDRFAEL